MCENRGQVTVTQHKENTKTASTVKEKGQQDPRIITPMGQQILPTVHIDLQIHISPEASPEQIDIIFASMAKHLYGRG
jgi:hypothetical protein